MLVEDLSGRRFGMWLVLERTEHPFSCGSIGWVCRCDCGTVSSVRSTTLRRGLSKSCGCTRPAEVRARATRHGHTAAGRPSREHATWNGMLERCRNPKTRNFKHYGARGIEVCERWQTFENFLADMGPRPPGMSLDRIDVNGGYEPANCRWATQTEQARNRRSNHRYEIRGEQLTAVEISERYGVPLTRLAKRLRIGWPVERAIAEPPRRWPGDKKRFGREPEVAA